MATTSDRTIASFKSQLVTGGARANQFHVELVFPTSLAIDNKTDLPAYGKYMCHAASLPASTVGDIEVMFRGRAVHVAGERTFQPWTVSMYNDNDFKLRNAFEQWQDAILNYEQTDGTVAPFDYQVLMSVTQLDRNGNVLKKYNLYDAYPTNVGQIQLSYDQNNQIESFDVDFVYNYFEVVNAT